MARAPRSGQSSKGKSKADEKRERDREKQEQVRLAEEKRVEAMKQSVWNAVNGVELYAAGPSPDRCEAAVKLVAEMVKNPKIPNDFGKMMRDRADEFLRNCMMKATSEAVEEALKAAFEDDKEARGKRISEARKLLGRALQNKAPPEFKVACERMLEMVMMTGGVHVDGPSRAKPEDTAPKPLNRAKGDVPMKFEEEQAAEASTAAEKTADAGSGAPVQQFRTRADGGSARPGKPARAPV
jgi:hypothetical protein